MRLSLRAFGLEVFTFEASTDEADDDTARDLSGGTTSAMPMGFVPQWGEQRYETGADQ